LNIKAELLSRKLQDNHTKFESRSTANETVSG